MTDNHQQMMQSVDEDLRVCREELAKGEDTVKLLDDRIKVKSEHGLDTSFEQALKDKITKINTVLRANLANADNSVSSLIAAYALMESLSD